MGVFKSHINLGNPDYLRDRLLSYRGVDEKLEQNLTLKQIMTLTAMSGANIKEL